MKAVSLYRPYGWKAKIGLIVPSTNTINEPEFWRMAPPGVAIHTSRVLLLGETTPESYRRMADGLDRACEELATAEVDVIAYGCTSGSIICPMEELLAGMRERARCPAIATAGAVVAALRALDVRRVALGTPYVDFVNQAETRFLEQYGFEVTSMHGLGLGETQEERRGIGRVPPEALYQMCRTIDRPGAQALFLSCTNVPSIDMIPTLEHEFGKPVVTSNIACFWACLRMLGIRTPVMGFGSLNETRLDPIDETAFALRAPR